MNEREAKIAERNELEKKLLALLTEEGVTFGIARSAMEHLLEKMQKGFKVFLDNSAASDVMRDFDAKVQEHDYRLREDF